MAEDAILELARPRPGTWGRRGSPGRRYVRTPEGSEKYGLPIGAPITRDAVERAKRRGRSYNVPEDDNDFGSQPPSAGRTRKNAKEMVSAIRSAPAPKRVTPDGPKKVAVGQSGYSFPEGSRTFRPNDHPNFAIVRTPDYQLVVATDKGIAFELDGDLERELNEELDDDASENFTADEPNELADTDGDGETGEVGDATAAPDLPATAEEMPGFVDDKNMQAILANMKSAGMDQAALDTAELAIHRNNNKLRQEWQAGQTSAAGGGNDGGDKKQTSAPADDDRDPFETNAAPTPDRQPELEEDGEPAKPKSDVDKLVDEIDAEARALVGEDDSENETKTKAPPKSEPKREPKSEPKSEPKREPQDELRDLEELTRNRSTGTAEGTVNGVTARLRRNRVSDQIEYELEDSNGNRYAAADASGALNTARSIRTQEDEAAALKRGQVVDVNGRKGLVIDSGENGVRVHLGNRGEATVNPSTVKRSREANDEATTLADAIDAGNADEAVIQDFLDDPSSAGRERRAAAQGGARDTSNLTPGELTDQELDDALDDLNDFLRTTGRTPAVTSRIATLSAEWRKRNPLIRSTDSDAPADDAAEEKPQTKLSSKIWGPNNARLDRAKRQELGIEAGQGDFANKTVDRRSALDARPGDKFIAKGGRSQQVWELGNDGQFYNLTLQNAEPLSRDEFADVIDDGNVEVYEYAKNRSNKADRPAPQPGDIATDTWAKDAPDGAAAYSGDGVIQERKNGEWQTPMGPVDAESFAPSDVADDDSVVARAEAPDDGRPVGATSQILSDADLRKVKSGDGLTIQLGDETLQAVKKDDGTYDVTLPDGLVASGIPEASINKTTGRVWHVPNRDITAEPTKSDWRPGDRIDSVDDILVQPVGTVLRYRYLKPLKGKTESRYTVRPDGEIESEIGSVLPTSRISGAISRGQVSIESFPELRSPLASPPELAPARVVTNPSQYQDGDKISDYRHLRNMKPGQAVTMVIPSHLNGGQEAKVTLTRTDDDKVMGGFMFLVGKRGRGYNSFGENNASIFQAIADGRLYFGDLNTPEDADSDGPLQGAWDTTPNIELWEGGPVVSEADLYEFINSQVYSPAMQTSYFDMSLLSPTNPFRQKLFRDEFAERAMKEYSEPGNPARHKPASIRFAAEKLGLKFTDPGSALIPDDLNLSDFKKKVTVGAWLRKDRNGVPLGKAAEENMGPEQIDVTAADLKTAFAAMDAMLERQDGTEDPDVILKRIFARQGSPLQDLNVAVAIASYYGMRRYRINPDGSETLMTTIARQKDKRNNKALLRQMLQEQLEGRAPGSLGIPKDETYTDKKGQRFVNRSTLNTPAAPSAPESVPPARTEDDESAPGPSPEAQGPATPERLQELNDSIPETNEPDAAPEPEAVPTGQAPSIFSLRADNPGTLYLEDANGNIITPKTHRRINADWDRPLVYDHAIAYQDRQNVFELDSSEQQTFLDVANRLAQGNKTYTAADLQGKRMYVNEDGTAAALLGGETVEALELDVSQTPDVAERALMNISSALVSRGARNAIIPDRTWWNDNMSQGGWRAASHTYDAQGGKSLITYTLDPELIGQPAQRTTTNIPTGDRASSLAAAKQWLDDYQKRDFHLALDKGRAGDGHYKGTKLWGKYGASGLLMRHVDANTGEERFMLVQRAGKNKNNPLYGKWQLPGGGLDSKETDAQGAARETIEEINPPAGVLASLSKVGENRFDDKSGWHYTNLTADIPQQFTPTHLDPNEILDTKWLTRAEIAQMETNGDLHPALSDSIRKTLATYGGTEATALPTQKPSNQPSIFGAKPDHGSIKDPAAKKIPGTLAGSNGGQQWDLPMADGSTGRYFVKPVKSVDQGKQEALAADLYRAAGARAPEADYSSSDRAFYSKMMDLRQRGPANFQDLVREDFAADAWLANWDVRLGDNIMFDTSGNPVRLDNGGSMEYRATGAKKPNFGNVVTELDTLRQAGNIGANTFGVRSAGQADPWEAQSAQKVVNIPDQTIRDLVTKHGLNQRLADTLIARRDNIAQRYNLTPVVPPAPAAPATPSPQEQADAVLRDVLERNPDLTPGTPAAPATPATPSAPLVGQGVTRAPLDAVPAGMVPTRGDAVRLTLPDGTTRDAVVNTPKVAGHGAAAALSSKLYRELGIGTVDAEWDPNANESVTSLVKQGPDAGAAGQADFRRGFVADAWLGNRAVGQQGKFVYDENGNAVRVDNRGSLDMRLNGQKKPDFGDTVSELDTLRDPAVNSGAAQLYGARQNGNFDDWEFDGAQKIIDLSDARIREMVREANADPALADTLIKRRDHIQSYYGLEKTGAPRSVINPDTFDSEPSLADARKAVGGAKGRYVRATLPQGQTYLDALKAAGNLDKAFEAAWKSRNPEKPDRISGGKITQKLTINSATDDDIIDLVATFDFDDQLLADKAKEMHSNPRDPRVLHEVLAEQRGFHDTNAPVDPTDIDKLVAGGQRHVFRTVNNHSGMTGVQAADQYKQDGYWRRGQGAKAHGEGIYVAQMLSASLGYGHNNAGVIEMAFDFKTSQIAPSTDFRGNRMNTIRARIQARSDLTAKQKDMLSRVFQDQGTAAMALGYDALYGNSNYGGQSDFNVLNKGKITFSDRQALQKHQIGGGYNPSNSDYRKAQQALQPTLKQANSLRGSAPAPTNAAGIQAGQTIKATDLSQLGIGSIVTVTRNGQAMMLRLTTRGWVNTTTNRVQKWVTTMAQSPRARTPFLVVTAN